MKRTVCVRILFIFILSYLAVEWLISKVYAVDITEQEKKKLIYIVYDNSASTYLSNNCWSEINYGVQAFYAMTNEEDEIKIYLTSYDTVEEVEKEIDLKGATKEEGVEQIKQIHICDGEHSITNVSQVTNAINGLSDNKDDRIEKWLVIFTDGYLEKKDENGDIDEIENVIEKLEEELKEKEKIHACYIAIDKEDRNKESYNSERIFQPKEEGDITKKLLEVCNHIYGRRSFEAFRDNGYKPTVKENNLLQIKFDIPISKCIFYGYCNETVDGELTESQGNINWQTCICPPENLKLSNGEEMVEPAISIAKNTGFIAELYVQPSENDFSYDITFPDGISNMEYEIYYEPAFNIEPYIQQNTEGNRQEINLTGEYEVLLNFINKETGEKVDEKAGILSVEEFEVKAFMDGAELSLTKMDSENKWKGKAQAGTIKFLASTIGIEGEKEVEFLQNYRGELEAEFDSIYYMDKLDKKEQSIRLKVISDEGNITDKIQALMDRGEVGPIEAQLKKEGGNCKSIKFEQKYNSSDKCWELFPVYTGEIDYFLNGFYDFEATIEIKVDYLNNTEWLGCSKKGAFQVGVSEGDIEIRIDNPWICKLGGYFIPSTQGTEISFWWKDQELPKKVFQDITINSIEEKKLEKIYQISYQDKKVEMKYKDWWDIFYQEDDSDSLILKGTAVLFGKEKNLYLENIRVDIYGMEDLKKWGYIILWTVIVLLIVAGLIWRLITLIIKRKDEKDGLRFPPKTRVYCLYNDQPGPIYGRIKSKVKRKDGIRYVEYTLYPMMLKKFTTKKKFKIKVKIYSQDMLEILDIPRYITYEQLFIGDQEYSEGSFMKMGMNNAIKIVHNGSKVEIRLDY